MIDRKEMPFWDDGAGVVHRLVYRFTWRYDLPESITFEQIIPLIKEAIAPCIESNRWCLHDFDISTPPDIRIVLQARPEMGPEEVLKLLLGCCKRKLLEAHPTLSIRNACLPCDYGIETI